MRERWFKNHKAVFEEHGPLAMLTWHQEKNSCYWARYIIHGRCLMVYGDIGEAAYGWSQNVSFDWIAGLELDYFAGKCCASESGRRFVDWDHRIAEERIREELQDPSMKEEWLDDALQHCSLKTEWQMWLHENGSDAFGADHYYELGEIGDVIGIRCQGHFVGIKMAIEQSKQLAQKLHDSMHR